MARATRWAHEPEALVGPHKHAHLRGFIPDGSQLQQFVAEPSSISTEKARRPKNQNTLDIIK